MKWLAEQFGRALVRRLAFLLVASVLAYFSVGVSRAGTFGCERVAQCTIEQAHAAALAEIAAWTNPAVGKSVKHFPEQGGAGSGTFCVYTDNNSPGCHSSASTYYYASSCPNGKVWNEVTQSCDSPCAQKPPLGPTVGLLQMEVCVGGCKYAGVPTKQITLESGASGAIDFGSFGGFTPTGATCGMPDQAQPEPYCAPINGQTVCVRPDGSHCHKAPTTKRFLCWRPGETGEKADGPDVSKTNAGPDAIPPSVSLPNGDTLTPAGPPVTTTTNIGGNTTTTTTNNYTTEHGTNAAPGKGQGVGDDSGPGDGEGEGDGDGDGKGSGSGGGDCDTPPSCSGNAIACWAVEVNWKQACNSRDSGIVGLNEMSDALNAATAAEAINWGATLGSDGEGDMHLTRGTRTIDPDDLDASGFLGAGSCPVLPTATVGGRALPIDMTKICEFLSNLSGFVLAVAYLLAFRIIGGGGRR